METFGGPCFLDRSCLTNLCAVKRRRRHCSTSVCGGTSCHSIAARVSHSRSELKWPQNLVRAIDNLATAQGKKDCSDAHWSEGILWRREGFSTVVGDGGTLLGCNQGLRDDVGVVS